MTPAGVREGARRHVQLLMAADSFPMLFRDCAGGEERAECGGVPRHHPLLDTLPELYNGHLDITYYCKVGCNLRHFLHALRGNPRFMRGDYDFVIMLWYGNELFRNIQGPGGF